MKSKVNRSMQYWFLKIGMDRHVRTASHDEPLVMCMHGFMRVWLPLESICTLQESN